MAQTEAYMKKITGFIISLFLCFSLSACSDTDTKQYTLEFFNALHHTFQANSAHIRADILMDQDDPGEILADLCFDQKEQLELALTTDLKAGGRTQNNFLDFYIKDGRTYLNSLGTKTQSTADKIGLSADSKLTNLDPFLDMSDDELEKLFTRAEKEEDGTYRFDIDEHTLASILDSYGSVTIDHAVLEAKIEDSIVTYMKLDCDIHQKISSTSIDSSVRAVIHVSDYDTLQSVPFPDDLSSYKK